MRILLTNDDGIYAPGLRALQSELGQLGHVSVVAPGSEQSGVGHSITILDPLIVRSVDEADGRPFGWAVEGSPADCVKLALFEILEGRPDLIVSGINNGSNTGINVLYSGTVAASIEGAFFGITSIAVSLELAEHQDYPYAARLAVSTIRKILANGPEEGSLFNVNLPSHARGEPLGVRVVPMGLDVGSEGFQRRTDPRGRTYYWMDYQAPLRTEGPPTDITSLAEGYVTVTPLHFDMTHHRRFEELQNWTWDEPPAK